MSATQITPSLTRGYLVDLITKLEALPSPAPTPESVRVAILTARREAWLALEEWDAQPQQGSSK